MTAITMDGEALAAEVKADLAVRMGVLAEAGITPGLGTILVGEDGPSAKYVAMKHRDCADLGMHSVDVRLPADASQARVDAAVDELNASDEVHAFIVQYPFPGGLDYEAAILRVDPAKDADGLHPTNLGHLVMGVEAPLACTPAGILAMLSAYEVPVAGRIDLVRSGAEERGSSHELESPTFSRGWGARGPRALAHSPRSGNRVCAFSALTLCGVAQVP